MVSKLQEPEELQDDVRDWMRLLGLCNREHGLGVDNDSVPSQDVAVPGPYFVHQLVRIYILAGQPEKAIDSLERLLKIHYWVSSAWLKIDPNFDPLRKNPRFQKLVASAR